MDEEMSETDALLELRRRLVQESARLQRQIATVQRTLTRLNNGGRLMASEMFDGFEHEQYKDEVEQRWGKEAYAQSDAWWTSLTAAEKSECRQRAAALNHDWQAAAEARVPPDSTAAQDLAARHVEWLRTLPTTMQPDEFRQYVLGLGEMYVNDPRFATNYGGVEGAMLVRDALAIYAAIHLPSN